MRTTLPIWRSIASQRIIPLHHHVYYSTATTSPLLSSIKQTFLSRKPKLIPDYLLPMPSHLLNTTLTDLISPKTSSSPSSSSSPKISSPPHILPPSHHLVYFPIQSAPSILHLDGADPDHSPGAPFTRRMWAGGEVIFKPGWEEDFVLDGREWLCKETIEDVRIKGCEGEEKVFVDVVRRYGVGHEDTDGIWGIVERRTLVFMRGGDTASSQKSSPAAAQKIIKYPHTPTASISVTPTSTHLFHFSALTFNAHEIHLNPLFAKSTDGHRNLLVHGPLTLTLMMRVLSDNLGKESVVSRVTYRNHAPLYVDEPMKICVRRLEKDEGKKWDVWVEGPEGGLAVKGTVETKRSDDNDGNDAFGVDILGGFLLAAADP